MDNEHIQNNTSNLTSKLTSKLTQVIYDTFLDILDSENTSLLIELFKSYGLNYNSKLFDAPRIGYNDKLLYTYLDYVLSHNLTIILEFLIDEINLVIDDTIISRCLELQNIDTYNYIIELGYEPRIKTLRCAVRNCYASIIESILINNMTLINKITDDDIAHIFNYTIDSDTVESIYTLFYYGISKHLFTFYIQSFINIDTDTQEIPVNDDEQEHILELINIYNSNN